jgi:hypothetical protein
MARTAKSKGHFWRLLRIYFRRFRITVLLVTLGFLVLLVYLNQHGLPGVVKRPILEKLRARGLELEFSRMRLRWHRGIVADDVRFGRLEVPNLPRLSAQEVEIDLDLRALVKGQWQVDALSLRGGRLVWTLTETNAPDRTLEVNDIEATLRLAPGDEWRLEDFRGRFGGGNFVMSGVVTNASAVRNWRFARSAAPGPGATAWPQRFRRLAESLDRVSFSSPPELRLMLDGDALDLASFTARLSLSASDADTPWGRAQGLSLISRLFPGAGRELSHLELNLRAALAVTPWADAAQLSLELDFDTVAGQTNLLDSTLKLRAASAQTKWASVTNVQFNANWIQSLTNPIPLAGRGELRANTIGTQWASATNVCVTASFDAATNPPPADAAWAWWTNLQPYQLAWNVALGGLQSDKLVAERFECAGSWRAPLLTIANLDADLHDHKLQGRAGLDVATRAADFNARWDFDVKRIADLLPPGAQRWLTRYTWAVPPLVEGSGAVTLPAWTNREPDWRGEVLPTLRLAGAFAVTNGTFRGVPVDWARSHFNYTNLTWHLPDLEAARPEGQLRLAHFSNDRTKEYYFNLQAAVDPQALRPVLSTNAQRGLDYFVFTRPPVVEGEIWGTARQPDSLGFKVQVALTNATFRGQSADAVVAQVHYTNRVVEFLEPRLWRGTQAMSAARITADFNTWRIHFTNGLSTAEPMVVARAIGPPVTRALEPYLFRQPPVARVNGFAPLKGSDADLRFSLEGGPFEWWKFRLPRVSGDLHWLGDTLTLTNMQSEFYWGNAAGRANFEFRRGQPGADFNFAMNVANVNLAMLVADLFSRTNELEGWLDGQLVVTQANSADSNSWQGYGRARLRDGLLWQLPIFGVLSKPLDSIVPGLGNSRFTEAKAGFNIADSVIHSNDLEMRAPTMRLQYNGSVTMDGRVDARVEAELLRDTWLIGRVVSLALWPVSKMLEFKITGTLENPKSEPVFIPKLFLAPLSPFQTLEDLFSTGPKTTNAPPVFKER